jgi:hypothetical protein
MKNSAIRTHTTVSWKPSCGPWFQIQRSHRHRARHRDSVRCSGRNAHRTVGRYNPCSVSSAYRHHNPRGINELIPIMEVRRDNLSGWIVARESCNRRFVSPDRLKILGWRICDIDCHLIESTQNWQSLA